MFSSSLLRGLYLLLGVGLLWLVLREIDLAEVLHRTLSIGWGMALILFLYFCAFLIDSFTWQMVVAGVPLNPLWTYRIWKVRMVGEVLNSLIPAGGMGGEPMKALILQRHFGIGLRDGAASLVMAKTINMVSLVIFLGLGLAWMSRAPELAGYQSTGAIGLGLMVAGTAGLLMIQLGPVSLFVRRVARTFPRLSKLERWLDLARDLEQRMIRVYQNRPARLTAAVTLALVNWVLGAVEVYYALYFLGHPITLTEAWIIESAAQLLRAGAFFVPAGIGVQEGAFMLLCTAVTGSAELGIAVALIRRAREIVWLLWGSTIGALFSIKRGVDLHAR